MTVDYMRWHLINEYHGDAWRDKVSRMPDNQVVAIYRSIINRKARKQEKKTQTTADEDKCYQLSMYDFMREIGEKM